MNLAHIINNRYLHNTKVDSERKIKGGEKEKRMRSKKAIGIILAVIIAVSVFTVVIPGIASEPSNTKVTVDISSASRAKSILQIENVKPNLTDAQKKLSTDLLQLLDSSFIPQGQNRETLEMQMKNLGQFRPASSISPTRDGRVADDLVYVYVYLKPLAGTPTIEHYVWEVTDRDEENHLAVAWVEVNELETLASLEVVRTIRTVMPPLVRTGSVTTEGDTIHRTSDVRATYSQNGSGVKVGIISDGVDSRATAQATNDLPPDGSGLTVLNNTQGGDEGTAMLEIVHDMVPGADLYFHDCGANTVAFSNAIDALVAAGCDVICDDIGWITQPFFEDGIIASHLTSVLASNDIIYASSAGNAGQRHYQGDYYNDGYDFHDFSRNATSNDYLYVNIPNNGEVTVVLQWNDKFGSSGNDYDLYLFDTSDWSVLDSSTYIQDGDDDPLEAFSYTNTGGSAITAEIDVKNYHGAAETKTLEVFIYTSNGASVYTNNIDPVDSIFGHAAVPDAIAAGAIAASDPGNDDIEPFSSQGPVTISYPSPVSRAKPDLCGIDGVTVTGAGGFPVPFYGTSAAAPHIAAIAAQLWGAFPAKTGDEIRAMLYSSAVDLGSAGYDNVFGYGRADALDAFVAIVPQPDIWVGPQSFDITLLPDVVRNYTLTIGNDGTDVLNFEMQIDYVEQLTSSAKTITYNSNDNLYSDSMDERKNGTGIVFVKYDTGDSQRRIVEINVTDSTSPSADKVSTSGYYDGFWEGTTNQGKPVSFNVSGDKVIDFYIEMKLTCATVKFHIWGNFPIQEDNFTISWTGYDKYTFVGTFISQSEAQGTWYFKEGYYGCWGSGTWMAEKPTEIHDMAVTDVYTVPSSPTVGQATTINVTAKNEGNQAESNVPVKAYVDGSQVDSTKYVSLSAGQSTTKSFSWAPSIAKTYSVKGEVGVVSGETDTADNTKIIDVYVSPKGWLSVFPTTGTVNPGRRINVTVIFNTTGLPFGDYYANINITSNDPDESVVTVPVHLTVRPEAVIFDTGLPENPYPSIFGTHNGTITPNQTIEVSKMYTYSCAGTGGHSEYAAFYNATTEEEIANGTWNGYQGAGDYHCIKFNVPFTLQENETYNYTIRTGSYPQIHHTPALQTANGWINCTKFTDANGKEYNNRIPAIRLE